MQTEPFLEAIRREVEAAGDDPAIARLAGALEASAQVWLLDVATQAAAQLNAQLAAGHVEVRLAGRDPDLLYVPDPEPDPAGTGDDYAARITLRLPESLKAQVEQWAAAEGVSVNTWLVRTIARGGQHTRRTPGRRLTGYGQS